MAAVDKLPDLILDNILARLPAKSLLRCRCVSKHWNRLITDPYFMKSRARRMIFVTDYCRLLNLVDDNDPTHSMLKICSPHESWRSIYSEVRAVGTINGIVLLQYYDGVDATLPHDCAGDLMLCNPFTRKYMLLPGAPWGEGCIPLFYRDGYSFPHNITYAYGFGYGNATPDDLKIVRIKEYNQYCPSNYCGGGVCEIFSLKTFTWSKPRGMNVQTLLGFEETVGKFLNGFLYWIPFRKNKLVVFDVAKLLLSEIHLPFQKWYNASRRDHHSHLGTIHGCLCLLNRSTNDIDFNLWVMSEQNSWSKRCSFALAKDDVVGYFYHHIVCILDNGRIVMGYKEKLYIYDTSDDSYTLTDVSISPFILQIHGIEYVETLVSLSDVCSAS